MAQRCVKQNRKDGPPESLYVSMDGVVVRGLPPAAQSVRATHQGALEQLSRKLNLSRPDLAVLDQKIEQLVRQVSDKSCCRQNIGPSRSTDKIAFFPEENS